jgi:hypothetical protein
MIILLEIHGNPLKCGLLIKKGDSRIHQFYQQRLAIIFKSLCCLGIASITLIVFIDIIRVKKEILDNIIGLLELLLISL